MGGGGGGIGGQKFNCGKTATNTCIIMPQLSRAKPDNPDSVSIIVIFTTFDDVVLRC